MHNLDFFFDDWVLSTLIYQPVSIWSIFNASEAFIKLESSTFLILSYLSIEIVIGHPSQFLIKRNKRYNFVFYANRTIKISSCRTKLFLSYEKIVVSIEPLIVHLTRKKLNIKKNLNYSDPEFFDLCDRIPYLDRDKIGVFAPA